MDDKQKIERFYAKAERYGGFRQVAAKRVHAIFEEIVDASHIEFEKVKRGYLARKVDEDIVHVLKLQATKGGAYGLSYGVSLSYVPYPYIPVLKWHRTLKSANLDLFEQPQEQMPEGDSQDKIQYVASGMLGEICFREEFGLLWQQTSPRILSWLEATSTLRQVLSRCDDHLAWNWRGPRHVPGARLVRAFTLAKLRRASEANAELEQFLREQQEDDGARRRLYAALSGVIG